MEDFFLTTEGFSSAPVAHSGRSYLSRPVKLRRGSCDRESELFHTENSALSKSSKAKKHREQGNLVFNGESKRAERAAAFAKFQDIPCELPGGGFNKGAANALKLVAEHPKVHPIDNLIRFRLFHAPILGELCTAAVTNPSSSGKELPETKGKQQKQREEEIATSKGDLAASGRARARGAGHGEREEADAEEEVGTAGGGAEICSDESHWFPEKGRLSQ